MNIFKKVIKEVKELDAALTEYKTPEFRKPTEPPSPKTMYGLKFFIPFDDLNKYICNHIDKEFKDHTFVPVKAEVNEVDLSIDITLLSANPIECDRCRYRLDLNQLSKEKYKMKIINLPRAKGKTTRLLYASEFNNIPILCSNQASKQHLLDSAKRLNLDIPEPITPSDVTMGGVFKTSLRDQDILVDEAPMVLQSLLNCLGMTGSVKAVTLTEKENTK